MSTTPSIIVCGLGPIGESVARVATAEGPGVVALVDVEPERLANVAAATGSATTFRSLEAALTAHGGAPVLLCTQSGFQQVATDLSHAARAGSSVVTSCEEAAWPWAHAPEVAREVDALAREHGSVVLGAGINPGFLMDLLPALLSAPFPEPRLLRAVRRVDVARRRAPLGRKVGLGLTREAFDRERAAGRMGHRGLAESLALLGALLGVEWERTEVTLVPVLAETPHVVLGEELAVGTVLGMRNVGRAWLRGELRVELDLVMAHGIEDRVDRIELVGDAPPLPVSIEVPGGVQGDIGTTRVLLSLLPRLSGMEPGLRTLADVPGGVRAAWRPGGT